MANNISYILKIKAISEKIEQVFKAVQSDTDSQQLFDYNKMIPMPKSLEMECDEIHSNQDDNDGHSNQDTLNT